MTSLSAVTSSVTTLTAPLTTLFTSHSLYTTDGKSYTTSWLVATVIPPGTEVIDQSVVAPKKKSNLVVIVAAALGGFVGVVALALLIFFLRRRRGRRPQGIHRPPSPVLPPPSLPPPTPYGYTVPGRASPAVPMAEIQSPDFNPAHLASSHQPPSPLSEKRQRQLYQQQRAQSYYATTRPSIDDTGGSVISQPYTTSLYSTPSAQAMLPAAANMHPAPVSHQGNRPTHQHQHSVTGSSIVSYGSEANRSVQDSVAPQAQNIHAFNPPGFPGSADGFHRRDESSSHSQPPPPPAWAGNMEGASSSTHLQPNPPPAFASGSQSHPAAGSATVDRGDGTSVQVYPGKGPPPTGRQMRRDDDDDDEYAPVMSEIPPTYDMVQHHRARRTGSLGPP